MCPLPSRKDLAQLKDAYTKLFEDYNELKEEGKKREVPSRAGRGRGGVYGTRREHVRQEACLCAEERRGGAAAAAGRC